MIDTSSNSLDKNDVSYGLNLKRIYEEIKKSRISNKNKIKLNDVELTSLNDDSDGDDNFNKLSTK